LKRIIILLISLSTTLGGESLDLLKIAIDKLDYGFIDYEFIMVDDQTMGGKRLLRVSEFSPSREVPFYLSNNNGKVPTKRDIKSYSKDKTNLFGKMRFNPDTTFSFKDLAEADSYELLEEVDGISRFSFINKNSVIPDNNEPLYGELWVNLESQEIKRVYLKNIEPLSVFIGISITTFELEFEFNPQDNNHTLIKDIDCEILGKVLFFKFDYLSNIAMSDYNYLKK
jgi:hypothetical protein